MGNRKSRYENALEWTDEQLLALVRRDDDLDAFSTLYRRYWKPLIDAAYQRLKTKEAAEEAVQAVFVNFFIKRREVELKSTIEAWLRTALKFHIYKTYRTYKAHAVYVEATRAEGDEMLSTAPDALLEAKELKTKVLEVVGTMPEKCRAVFMLSRFEQLTQQEIAERLHISVSTVKKHMNKAMGILRAAFTDHPFAWLVFLFWLS